MNNVILSARYPQLGERLKRRGYHVIHSESLDRLIPYERDHADLQCLILDDTAFVCGRCWRLAEALGGLYRVVSCADDIRADYPHNVALSAVTAGKYLIARIDSLDAAVREYAVSRDYELVNVRQGYAKCACATVSDNAIITADRGIYHSLKELNIDLLLIEEGRVALDGADYGFIGGASGLDVNNGERTLYFSGSFDRHPDAQRIRAFCEKHRTEIISLTDDELIDIGGMIFC